ncbi:MAG: TetR/AcrR family transcriptional regulator, partial [Rhizobiaceae bacterium]
MAISASGGRRDETAREGAPRRRDGKERIRDPERTRGNILKAATIEFSERGFAGASVDSIATRSGANKRMIYHYFGNKRGLWLTTLEAAYERARSAEQQLRLD